MAASTSHGSLLRNPDIVQDTSLYAPTILAGEIAVTFFSALMGIVGAARLMQALARDKLFPGLFLFGRGTKRSDEPFAAVFLTYLIAQLALLANLDQLASLVSIFYMVSHVHYFSLCLLKSLGLSTARNSFARYVDRSGAPLALPFICVKCYCRRAICYLSLSASQGVDSSHTCLALLGMIP